MTSFAEVSEALRAPSKLAVVVDRGDRPTRDGTVLRIDGGAHTRRRRMLNRLVLRDRHADFRRRALVPAIERDLADIRSHPDADGVPRVDLVAFCGRSLIEMMAAIIGLDDLGPAAVDELVLLQARCERFLRLMTQLGAAAPPAPEDEISAARDAFESGKREFIERFYEPALARRRELCARAQAGELPESELPLDLLTLVASHAEPSFDADADLAVREAVVDLLHAGTGTTVGAVVHTVDELSRWWDADLEDRARRTDARFLAGAASETLRLHAANPAEVRRAVADVTLSGGTVIRAGQLAALRTGIADRDPTVFGPDPDRFDPYRSVPPGVNPFGAAFGAGPHMCYGVPVAFGNDGTDGNIVCLLRALYEAGMEPDLDRPARARPGIAHADLRNFDSYPVVFRR